MPFNGFLLLDDELTTETWGGKETSTPGMSPRCMSGYSSC